MAVDIGHFSRAHASFGYGRFLDLSLIHFGIFPFPRHATLRVLIIIVDLKPGFLAIIYSCQKLTAEGHTTMSRRAVNTSAGQRKIPPHRSFRSPTAAYSYRCRCEEAADIADMTMISDFFPSSSVKIVSRMVSL